MKLATLCCYLELRDNNKTEREREREREKERIREKETFSELKDVFNMFKNV